MDTPREYASILAQDTIQASTRKVVYTVPTGMNAHIARIFWTNTDWNAHTFSFGVAKAWAADAVKQYLYSNLPLSGNDCFVLAADLGLESWDQLFVNGDSSLIAVNVHWSEFRYKWEK